MEILISQFEGPISNNNENKNFASPLGRPWQKIFFFGISFIDMEILVFKFGRPISNNKENKDFVPPLGRPWQKYFF